MNDGEAQRMQNGPKCTQRVYVPFTQSEIEAIDGWGFSQRIRDRSQVIRTLALKGLEVSDQKSFQKKN